MSLNDRRSFLRTLIAAPFAALTGLRPGTGQGRGLMRAARLSAGTLKYADSIRGVSSNVPTLPDDVAYIPPGLYEEVARGFATPWSRPTDFPAGCVGVVDFKTKPAFEGWPEVLVTSQVEISPAPFGGTLAIAAEDGVSMFAYEPVEDDEDAYVCLPL